MAQSTSRYFLTAAVAVVAVGALLTWQLTARRRALHGFAADVARGHYADAAARLAPPSMLSPQTDGSLLVVDRHSRRKVVIARQLPFVVGSGPAGTKPEDQVSLIALGPDDNGVLKDPAVQMSISFEQGRVQIERLD